MRDRRDSLPGAASARHLGGSAVAVGPRMLSARVRAAYRADMSADQADRQAPNAVLRRLRREAGMSQAELVEALRAAGWDSCDRRTIQRYESGAISAPTWVPRRALEAVFGRSLRELGFPDDLPAYGDGSDFGDDDETVLCDSDGVITGGTGQRIAAYRRRRGLSQAALAQLVGRSESWLSQVERGIRSVDRLSVLLDMARVLDVDVESLTGKPWKFAPNGPVLLEGIGGLRTMLTRYGTLLGEEPEAAADLRVLQGRITELHRSYQAANYDKVLEELPPLLTQVEHSLRTSAGDDRRDAQLAYVSSYVAAAKLVTKLGVTDLAMLTADRAAHEAAGLQSLSAEGLAAYQVVCALLRAEQLDDAENLAVSMAERIERAGAGRDQTLLSVTGALWLIAAIIAGRRADRGTAWERLDRADRLAAELAEDGNYAWTAFGPTNVAIHRVAVAAELGDPGEAIRAADAVDERRLPDGLASRRAQVHLDLAWAHAQRKRDAEATLHLLEAERIAPSAIRHNVIAQEMVREMLARAKKSRTSALSELAARAGLLH
jgi:transcriptional regulator with XRE-family HTH domain